MGIPFIIGASQQKKKRILGFEPYVAPDNFDRKAQPVDIYDVFERYYRHHSDAKYIYSFTSAIDTLSLSSISGTSYRWGETIGGVDYVYDITSGTAFTAGSTKRYVIIIMNTDPNGYYGVELPLGSIWAYFGITNDDGLTCIFSRSNTYLTYIHFHKLTALKSVGPQGYYWMYYQTNITGTLHFPPDWTTSLGGTTTRQAFNSCRKITNIDFANAEVIHTSMFVNCTGLTSLDFSTTKVKTFLGNEGTFAGCTGLTSLNLEGVVSINTSSAFGNCTNLVNVDFGSTIQLIGPATFSGCSKMSGTLTLPNSLVAIGFNAFYGCTSLTGTLTIPSGITSIGQGAFGDDNFTDIDVTANAGYEDVDNVLYEISTRTALHSVKGNTGTLTFQSNTLIIGDHCCLRNLRTGTLTVPDSVTRVGIYAFYDCDGFTALVLETSSSALEMIDDSAFAYQSNLAGTITIPDSVTLIDSHAFRDIPKITTIVIGNGVVTIGSSAFLNDVAVTSITFGTGLVTIGADAFRQMTAITENLVIPNSVETIGATAFHNNVARTGTLTLGTGLKTIGRLAFDSVPFTGTLAIPSLVTAIGERAFLNNNFSAISSAASGFTVSDYVLYDETTSGQIKAHTSARGYAGTLTLKTGTTSILVYCFYKNTNRSGTLTLLSTITNINTAGFEGCTAFNRVDSYPATAPTVASAGLTLGGTARPLHIPTGGGTGYGVAPWTTATIFTQPPVADL